MSYLIIEIVIFIVLTVVGCAKVSGDIFQQEYEKELKEIKEKLLTKREN